MNTQERKARFTELMTTFDLLGDPDNEGYDPVIPQGTLGLSDSNLKAALIAQAVRVEDEQFIGNMINALARTGFEAIVDKANNDQTPSDDDLSTVTMAIHVAWAIGAFTPMAMMMGTFAKMVSDLDLDVPEDLLLVLRPNTPIREGAKNEDPIALLDMTIEDLMKKVSNDDNE
jgi:hypothetical protein